MWICEHLWHLWTKCDHICFTKKTKIKPEQVTEVTNWKLWHFETVTNFTHWVWQLSNLFLFGIRIGTALKWSRLDSSVKYKITLRIMKMKFALKGRCSTMNRLYVLILLTYTHLWNFYPFVYYGWYRTLLITCSSPYAPLVPVHMFALLYSGDTTFKTVSSNESYMLYVYTYKHIQMMIMILICCTYTHRYT